MELAQLEDTKYLVKRVLFSHTEPVGTPGTLWIHTDPVSRCTVYFLWENNQWHNLFDNGTHTIEWNQILTSGTKIATITIDGTSTDVYAPEGSEGSDVEVTPIISVGTKIATITIDDTPYDIYAPAPAVQEAPVDGKKYVRKNGQWVEDDDGIEDAPTDNRKYGRKNGQWVEIVEGGSGGSDVEVTAVFNTGTKIATITVDDVPVDLYIPSVIDNLTTAQSGNGILDAHQGKILKDYIGNLNSLQTTSKTDLVSAINELVNGSSQTISKLTQAEYDALSTKAPNVLYVIVD